MSTATATSPATSPAPAGPAAVRLGVTPGRVLRSEWTKFRSLRSTVVTLVVAVVLTIGLGALFAAVTAQQSDVQPAAQDGPDAIGLSLGGFMFSQLAIGVLAVLLVTGEYSTGMIRASLTAVPRRLPVLWAKLAVFSAVVFPASLVVALVAFMIGQALLDSTGQAADLGTDGAVRAIVGVALYVTVAGAIAMGLGTLMRNTAAAITTFVGLFFVVPPLTALLPQSWSEIVAPYLPSVAGGGLWDAGTTGAAGDAALSPWVGFAVLCAYAVVVLAAAAWRLVRSDA